MGKKTKEIIEWIDAYNKLINMNIKYFVMSINTKDKILFKKYRDISDKYDQGINNLINKLP